VLDFQCPYTTHTHICNQAEFGAHNSYYVDFVCPYVVPLCLRYDDDLSQFVDHVCSVQDGYSPTEVLECLRVSCAETTDMYTRALLCTRSFFLCLSVLSELFFLKVTPFLMRAFVVDERDFF